MHVKLFLFDFKCYCYSSALEVEVGGGRKLSDYSTVRMLYCIGIQVIMSMQAKE